MRSKIVIMMQIMFSVNQVVTLNKKFATLVDKACKFCMILYVPKDILKAFQ